jgi:tetratricopeptide (TPR) repeat protein
VIDPPVDRAERKAFYQERYLAEGVRVTKQMLDEEIEFAEKCLECGDFERGLHAVGVVIAYNPHPRQFTALLERFFDTDPDQAAAAIDYLELTLNDAAHALRLFATLDRGDAARTLAEFIETARHRPHLDLPEAWGLRWLSEKVMRQVPVIELNRFFSAFVHNRYGEPEQVTEFGRELLKGAVARIDLAEQVHGKNDTLTLVKCQMLSKAGRFDDAIREAEEQAERSPSFNTATAAAMANKRAKRIDRAVEWFRRASELDHTNETGMLDVGDLMIDAGNYRAALAAYEEALRRVPNHDWATPSAIYCRYMISKSPDALAMLRNMAHGPRCTCGCASAFKSMMGGYNYEDRQQRAEVLMRLIDPSFTKWPTVTAVDDESVDE